MKSKRTSHFGAEQWADFVNDQLSSDQRQAMQDHLDAGCEGCVRASTLWRQVEEAAKREALYEAPEWAVRYLRNAFTASELAYATKSSLRIPHLVLDSFWQAAPAGVRSGGGAPRHLYYKSDDIAIEMQVERELNSENVSVTGQVSNAATGGEGLAGLPIQLASARRQLLNASTNKFGEFRLTFAPEKGLQFLLKLKNGETIAIPVAQPQEFATGDIE
jgi:hypothetical protein